MEEYIPKLNGKKIGEVHKHFEERLNIYKKRGLDFDRFRKFILDKMPPVEGDILELGTGNGYTALFLAKEGYKFVSIDTDEEALKTAAARLAYDKVLPNVKFYIMDATRLGFSDCAFSCVIAVNLLHHVEKPEKLLSETDRVLCKKGNIVISDFNEEGRKIIDAVHREEGRAHEHPLLDQARIRFFFEEKGYKIKEFEDSGHWVLIGEKR